MLHYQNMHNPVLLPHSWASLHWIFLKRFLLAVCVHSPAHAPEAEPCLYWSQWHNRAGLGFHSTASRFHRFSAVASPNYFFPAHLEHKHSIIATQSNLPTADFFQSMNTTTEFCIYWGAFSQIYTQENVCISHLYLVIYFKITDNTMPSHSLPDVSISLYSSQQRNRNQSSILFFLLKSSNGQNIKHYLMFCRKLHGNLHTEIHTQHFERVSLHSGSTEMTMLLLVFFEVSEKKEKKQRDH